MGGSEVPKNTIVVAIQPSVAPTDTIGGAYRRTRLPWSWVAINKASHILERRADTVPIIAALEGGHDPQAPSTALAALSITLAAPTSLLEASLGWGYVSIWSFQMIL